MSETQGEASNEVSLDREKMRTFIRNVRQEIINIQSGESQFRTGAMHFEKGKSGAVNRLDLFEASPTKKNLDLFIEIASQDFGKRAGDAFKTWSLGLFPQAAPVATVATATKDFAHQIQDSFYECFKVARIPLDPTQIGLLENATKRAAKAFQEEITNVVKTQLKEVTLKLATVIQEETKKAVEAAVPKDVVFVSAPAPTAEDLKFVEEVILPNLNKDNV